MNSLSGFRAISAKNMTERHFKIKSSRFLASFPKVLFHVRNINTNCIQVQYYLLKSLQKYNDDSEETFDLILLNRFLMSLSLIVRRSAAIFVPSWNTRTCNGIYRPTGRCRLDPMWLIN